MFAELKILNGLKELCILNGDVDEMFIKWVIYYFMPHGIGHYIGLYVHDLPGLLKYESNDRSVAKMNLWVRRNLSAGMVLTCEPGIYFNT